MLLSICFGWSPLSQRESGHSLAPAATEGEGDRSSLGLPRHCPVGWPLGEGGQGAGGTGKQQGGRHASGAGGGPDPALQQSPRAGPAVLGDGAGSGSSSSRAPRAATVRPGGQGSGKTTPRRRQSEGSALRARPREPNRPLPERAISRPQSSRRLSQASAGLARTLPLAALESPTPPAPHARLGCAHGRLTLCRRRSCCRPDRRRYRSPPFAVSAPKGTRVNEEGPRNITPPLPAAGAVRSAA